MARIRAPVLHFLTWLLIGSACAGDMLRPLSPLDHLTSVSLSFVIGSGLDLGDSPPEAGIFYRQPERSRRFQSAVRGQVEPLLRSSGIEPELESDSQISVGVFGHRESMGGVDCYVYLVQVDAFNSEVDPEESGMLGQVIGVALEEDLGAALADAAVRIIAAEIESRVPVGQPRSVFNSTTRSTIQRNGGKRGKPSGAGADHPEVRLTHKSAGDPPVVYSLVVAGGVLSLESPGVKRRSSKLSREELANLSVSLRKSILEPLQEGGIGMHEEELRIDLEGFPSAAMLADSANLDARELTMKLRQLFRKHCPRQYKRIVSSEEKFYDLATESMLRHEGRCCGDDFGVPQTTFRFASDRRGEFYTMEFFAGNNVRLKGSSGRAVTKEIPPARYDRIVEISEGFELEAGQYDNTWSGAESFWSRVRGQEEIGVVVSEATDGQMALYSAIRSIGCDYFRKRFLSEGGEC